MNELVPKESGGEFLLNRAEYGKQIIKELSAKLNKKYGKGFSSTKLKYFRQFYVVYSNRSPKIRHKACGELISMEKLHGCITAAKTLCGMLNGTGEE